MNIKKLIAGALSGMLILSLAGCNTKSPMSSKETSDNKAVTI